MAVVCLAPGAAGESGVEVAFQPPAQLQGNVEAEVTWAMVVVRSENAATFRISSQEPVVETNGTFVTFAKTRSPEVDSDGYRPIWDKQVSQRPNLQAQGVLGQSSYSYLYLEGELALESSGFGILGLKTENECMADLLEGESEPSTWSSFFCPPGAQPFIAHEAQSVVRLRGHNIRQIHWLGAKISCPEGECPQGGGIWRQELLNATGRTLWNEYQTDIGLSLKDGTFDLEGEATMLFAGRKHLDIGVLGSIRLPRATGFEGCEAEVCYDADNRTLRASGNLRLGGLEPKENGMLTTRLGGDFSSAAIDETPIDPAIFMAATATGALGTAAVISIGIWGIYALLPFLTRMTPEHALKNDRRRALHDYIIDHPGATFREALRGAGVAAGTGQHHIAMLKRCGLLMVQRHRQTIRLFPNHGQFDQSWQRMVFLREPQLQHLYDLLDQQPGASQSSILDQAALQWGWSRSTTQHRLSRLVGGGLATVHARGRYLHYSTVAPAAERRFGLLPARPVALPSTPKEGTAQA